MKYDYGLNGNDFVNEECVKFSIIPWEGVSWLLDIEGSLCSNWFGVENTGCGGI